MNKCIVRTLDCEINNNNLDFIDGLYLEINTESPRERLFSIAPLKGEKLTIEVIGEGEITNNSGTTNFGKSVTISYTEPYGSTNLRLTNNVKSILIRDCSKLQTIGNIHGTPTCFVATVNRFKRCVNATALTCSEAGDFVGDITDISNLTKVKTLYFYQAQITGNWENFIEEQVKLGRKEGEVLIRIHRVLFNGKSLSTSAKIIYSENKVEVFDGTLKGTYENNTWNYVEAE